MKLRFQGIFALFVIFAVGFTVYSIADKYDVIPAQIEGAIDDTFDTAPEVFDTESIAKNFGTAVHLNLKMKNGLTGANIGDGSNDHIYILEVTGSDWTNPAHWETEGGWDDVLPDSDGTLSEEYRTGQEVILFCKPAAENYALYKLVVPAPVSPNDNQVTISVPVYTKTSSDTDYYRTADAGTVSASTNIDYSTEGSDGTFTLTCELLAATADAGNFISYVDPALSSGKQKVYQPYVYVTTNSSAISMGADAVTYDGSNWHHWFSMESAGITMKEPKGIPDYLEMVPVIGGQMALINDAGTSVDNDISFVLEVSGAAANKSFTVGWEYQVWENNFGTGTPSGDVTEALVIQA